jgi:hypothetical protein
MPGINDAIPIILAFKKEGKFLKVSISWYRQHKITKRMSDSYASGCQITFKNAFFYIFNFNFSVGLALHWHLNWLGFLIFLNKIFGLKALW